MHKVYKQFLELRRKHPFGLNPNDFNAHQTTYKKAIQYIQIMKADDEEFFINDKYWNELNIIEDWMRDYLEYLEENEYYEELYAVVTYIKEEMFLFFIEDGELYLHHYLMTYFIQTKHYAKGIQYCKQELSKHAPPYLVSHLIKLLILDHRTIEAIKVIDYHLYINETCKGNNVSIYQQAIALFEMIQDKQRLEDTKTKYDIYLQNQAFDFSFIDEDDIPF